MSYVVFLCASLVGISSLAPTFISTSKNETLSVIFFLMLSSVVVLAPNLRIIMKSRPLSQKDKEIIGPCALKSSLRVSNEVSGPLLASLFFRSYIVLPEYVLSSEKQANLKPIILHEKSHKKSFDALMTNILLSALVFSIFYPLYAALWMSPKANLPAFSLQHLFVTPLEFSFFILRCLLIFTLSVEYIHQREYSADTYAAKMVGIEQYVKSLTYILKPEIRPSGSIFHPNFKNRINHLMMVRSGTQLIYPMSSCIALGLWSHSSVCAPIGEHLNPVSLTDLFPEMIPELDSWNLVLFSWPPEFYLYVLFVFATVLLSFAPTCLAMCYSIGYTSPQNHRAFRLFFMGFCVSYVPFFLVSLFQLFSGSSCAHFVGTPRLEISIDEFRQAFALGSICAVLSFLPSRMVGRRSAKLAIVILSSFIYLLIA